MNIHVNLVYLSSVCLDFWASLYVLFVYSTQYPYLKLFPKTFNWQNTNAEQQNWSFKKI